MVRCPVCGLEVDAERPAATLKFNAMTFYFNSLECREEFERNPQMYSDRAAA